VSYTNLDSNQVIKTVYDADADALKTVNVGTLVTGAYDAVTAEYPSATVEIYRYRVGGASGTIIASVTVTYTDASKEVFVSAEKS